MLVYLVEWRCYSDSVVKKGRGRPKLSNSDIAFTVLCRNSSDAVYTLQWYFDKKFFNPNKFDFTDGVITVRLFPLDSRSFNIHYLRCDGIPEPIDLSNLEDSLKFYRLNYW